MKDYKVTALPPKEILPAGVRRRLFRIRGLVLFFIAALVISGVTAIPLQWEMEILTRLVPLREASDTSTVGGLARWLDFVETGLAETNARFPFMAYGTDWLAFGHGMIAVVFIGAWRDPVRNAWLFTFGMIACVSVIPVALIFGELRGIPFGWRMVDCAFGVVGFPFVWFARRETGRLCREIDELVS